MGKKADREWKSRLASPPISRPRAFFSALLCASARVEIAVLAEKCMLRQDLKDPVGATKERERKPERRLHKEEVARDENKKEDEDVARAHTRTERERERERETQTRHAREETARDARLSPSKDPVARIVSPARVVSRPLSRSSFTGEHSRRALRAEKRKERRLQSWLPSSSAAA